MRFPEPDMDRRDARLYEASMIFEERMLQRHPRKFSDDEYVFLCSRINTRDPRMAHAELRDWVKDNAKEALLNEPPSGYPR
eukprot:11321195-Karenia_brevis.AAC.1